MVLIMTITSRRVYTFVQIVKPSMEDSKNFSKTICSTLAGSFIPRKKTYIKPKFPSIAQSKLVYNYNNLQGKTADRVCSTPAATPS